MHLAGLYVNFLVLVTDGQVEVRVGVVGIVLDGLAEFAKRAPARSAPLLVPLLCSASASKASAAPASQSRGAPLPSCGET